MPRGPTHVLFLAVWPPLWPAGAVTADPESAQLSAQPRELSLAGGWVRLLLLPLEACH